MGSWTVKLLRGRQKMRRARTSAQVAAHYVVAEALTDAAKHAQASKVNVCVEGEGANIRDARTRLNCARPTGRSGENHGAPTSASKRDE
jgi:ribosomal protein S11